MLVPLSVSLIAVMMLPQAALAPLRTGLSVSPANRLAERDYSDPLLGNTGGQVNGTPSGCDGTFFFCDTIPLELGVPARITNADSYRLVIELSWDDINKTNDLDLYFYSCSKSPKDRYGTCSSVASSAALGAGCCEKIAVADLPASHYYILPQNVAGQNFGYHLKVMYTAAPFKPRNTPTSGPTLPAGTPTEKASPRPSSSHSPSPTGISPAPVKTFGSDAPASKFKFPFLTKGESAQSEGRSLVWVWFIVLALVLVLVPALVVLTRRRRTRRESKS